MSRCAFLFPGQGSQKIGMGSALAEASPAAREVFATADRLLGYPLSALCFEGPEERLRETVHTQPALFTASCAALAALREVTQADPFAAAGHSVGEYAALHAAGAMSFESGLALVRRRAELMHAAALERPGAMAAVLGLDADAARAACEAARPHGVVNVANFNCPGQVVISGENAAVEAASEAARAAGARRVIPLAVSGAFHSPLMVAAGDALYPDLRAAILRDTRYPVVVNVTAEYCRSGVDFAPNLTMQVSGSVRWEESMRLLLADGVSRFIEVGPGDVLAGLLKRMDREATVVPLSEPAHIEAAAELLAAG